jgi:hypothetical protein
LTSTRKTVWEKTNFLGKNLIKKTKIRGPKGIKFNINLAVSPLLGRVTILKSYLRVKPKRLTGIFGDLFD